MRRRTTSTRCYLCRNRSSLLRVIVAADDGFGGERHVRAQQRREFTQRAHVHPAFERHHVANRVPITHPAPVVELGPLAQGEAHVGVVGQQTKQIPDLLLADAHGLVVLADEAARQTVAQPATRVAENLDVLRPETQFLIELAEQGFVRRLIAAYAALRKLPRILPDTPRPQQAAAIIAENDPDIRAVSIKINHLCGPQLEINSILSQNKHFLQIGKIPRRPARREEFYLWGTSFYACGFKHDKKHDRDARDLRSRQYPARRRQRLPVGQVPGGAGLGGRRALRAEKPTRG